MRGPLGWGVFGRLGGMVGLRWMQTPEQRMNRAALQQEKVNEVLAKQDARYDSMSDAERETYYLKPSLMTKIRKALRGQ